MWLERMLADARLIARERVSRRWSFDRRRVATVDAATHTHTHTMHAETHLVEALERIGAERVRARGVVAEPARKPLGRLRLEHLGVLHSQRARDRRQQERLLLVAAVHSRRTAAAVAVGHVRAGAGLF